MTTSNTFSKYLTKMTKCDFARTELNFLGNKIGTKGVSPDPEKVKAIREMAPSKTMLKGRSFIGALSYDRRFVGGFSEKAESLIALTRKNTRFQWSSNCQATFQQLKEDLENVTVSAHPNIRKSMILYCDAPLTTYQPSADAEGKYVSRLYTGTPGEIAPYLFSVS